VPLSLDEAQGGESGSADGRGETRHIFEQTFDELLESVSAEADLLRSGSWPSAKELIGVLG
jgi:hypothetical protein